MKFVKYVVTVGYLQLRKERDYSNYKYYIKPFYMEYSSEVSEKEFNCIIKHKGEVMTTRDDWIKNLGGGHVIFDLAFSYPFSTDQKCQLQIISAEKVELEYDDNPDNYE